MEGERHARKIDPDWPEWVIRQGSACVWVKTPSAMDAIELSAKHLRHMGGGLYTVVPKHRINPAVAPSPRRQAPGLSATLLPE